MGKSYLLSSARVESLPLRQCACPSDLVDLAFVRRLVQRFDWNCFGYPVVWETDSGELRVLDGVQRITTARSLFGPAQMIDCQVFRGLTVERAEALRAARNDHVPADPDEPPRMRLISR